MLSVITLKDFISYEYTKVNIHGAKSVVVVGDNGVGKSTLLEALIFADYGIGRFQYLNEYARSNSGGSFEVEVIRTDVPSTGNILRVCRGMKDGKGFAKVWLDDVLKAKGKEVSTYVAEITGLDADSTMLTSFFGLGDNDRSDPLLKVLPSKCLETLQKIANVFIYTKFYKRVSDDLKSVKRSMELLENSITVMQKVVEDVPTLKKSLEKAKKGEELLITRLSALRTKRNELTAEEEKYQAIVRERDTLQERRKQLRSIGERTAKELGRLKNDIEYSKGDLDESIEDRESLQSEIAQDSVEQLSDIIGTLTSAVSSKQTMKKLKSVASDIQTSTCPLCESPITEKTIKGWQQDIIKLDTELKKLISDKTTKGKELKDLLESDKRLVALKRDIKNLIASIENDKAKFGDTKSQRTLNDAALNKADARYTTLCKRLNSSGYSKVSVDMQAVNDRTETYQRQSGAVKQEITTLQDSIAENIKRNRELKSNKQELFGSKKTAKALSILVDAWSRYGIPLNLLKDLTAAIEDRATAIYQEFDSGMILVQDVEGNKPGVRFILKDRKGSRSFGGLSLGEKVMFYIAVRVAVSQIIAAARDIKVDCLVLDEGMGNLSPKNRDNLVRMINKVLRKIFPQVILTSHTELPEIFDRTIQVEVDGDVSKARVL